MKRSSYDPIRIIAKIDSVGQAVIALKSGGSNSEDTAPVEVDTSSNFVAKGSVLNVIPSYSATK
jgi:hypothetical protein